MEEAKEEMIWVIGDDEGVLHQGTEEEMSCAMQVMTWDEKTLRNMHTDERLEELKQKYRVPHVGKLLMTQV